MYSRMYTTGKKEVKYVCDTPCAPEVTWISSYPFSTSSIYTKIDGLDTCTRVKLNYPYTLGILYVSSESLSTSQHKDGV